VDHIKRINVKSTFKKEYGSAKLNGRSPFQPTLSKPRPKLQIRTYKKSSSNIKYLRIFLLTLYGKINVMKINRTISVDSDLWLRFEVYCNERGYKRSNVIDNLIEKEVYGGKEKEG